MQSKRDEEQLKSIVDLKINKNKVYKNDKNNKKNNNLKYMNNINNQDDDIHYGRSFNNLGNGNNMEIIKNRINKVNKFNFTNSVRLRKNNVGNKKILSFDVKRTNKDNYALKNFNGNFSLNNYLNNENDMNYNNIKQNSINYNNYNNYINNEFKNNDNNNSYNYNFNYNYNYNSNIKSGEKMKNYNSYQNINYKNINDLYYKNDNKSKDITNLKYNFSSYFRLDDKYKNIYDVPTLNNKSYFNNNFKNEINYTKNGLNENNISYGKSRSISLTPNGFYRINSNDNNEYINIRTDSIENNSNANSIQTDKKEEPIKTISQNNNMTQSRFYKRIIPNENQNLNNNNFEYCLKEFKNRNNKNRYNEKIENNRISHSFTNLTYNSLINNNAFNDYSNSYNIINNSLTKNSTYNSKLYNNNYNIDSVNDLNYNNSINSNMNKTLNTFRTSNILKRGNSYTNLHSLLNINNSNGIIRNDERTNLNETISNNYNKSNISPKTFSDIRNYKISSPPNDFNNYMNSINMNQKKMGSQNENLCNTCLRRRMLNDNDLEDIFSYQREKNYISRNNSQNIFRNNMKKLCQNCQNMYHLNKFKQI